MSKLLNSYFVFSFITNGFCYNYNSYDNDKPAVFVFLTNLLQVSIIFFIHVSADYFRTSDAATILSLSLVHEKYRWMDYQLAVHFILTDGLIAALLLMHSFFVNQDKSSRVFLPVGSCLSAACLAEVALVFIDLTFTAAVSEDKLISAELYHTLYPSFSQPEPRSSRSPLVF